MGAASSPTSFLVLGTDAPCFTVLAVTDAYVAASKRPAASVVGKSLFTDDVSADAGVLRASLERVLKSGSPDTLAAWRSRWRVINSPALSPSGEVLYIVHCIEGVGNESGMMARPPREPSTAWCFASDDEMSRLVQEFDWSRTLMGPINSWPVSLQCALNVCLSSLFPMSLWIGTDFLSIYNDAHRRNMGAKHPRALGRSARENFPEAWKLLGPMLESVLRTGRAVSYSDEMFLLDRSGYLEESYWNLSKSPIRAQTGEVVGVFGCLEETTARVVGDRRLRTLRDLSVQTTKAVTMNSVCELAVGILAENPRDVPFALLYLLVREPGTLQLVNSIGSLPESCTPITDVDATTSHNGPIGEIMHEAWSKKVLAVTRLADGTSERPRQIAALPLLPLGLLIIGMNPYKELDEQYKTFLSLVASQLTSSLSTVREREREKQRAEELAALDRAKTTFFHNVSHEFRTPLTLMLGPIEELLQEAGNNTTLAPMKERLKLAHKNVLRLLKLVNMLLDFSRIEAGRMQATYRCVDLARVTEDLTSLFRAACEKAGLCLEFVCKRALRSDIYVDPEMWEKIVLNLLSNAFKFTLKGSIVVQLGDNDSDGVTLSVRDTGCGIPSQEMPRLFERFHRIEGSRGRSQEGTGIGLAFVYELVRLQGGSISAESVENQGTTFFVSLPYSTAHLPLECVQASELLYRHAHLFSEAAELEQRTAWSGADSDQALMPGEAHSDESGNSGSSTPPVSSLSSSLSSSGSVVSLNRPRLLVVDDNADMRQYLQRILCTSYAVHTAADGEAALEYLRSHAQDGELPELVISDIMMPRLNGLGLLHAIRQAEAPVLRDLPVLLLSARAGSEASAGGIEAGADDYLIKPFSAKELLARVAGRLELVRHRKAAVRQQEALRAEAEQANAAKDRFLAVLSHELRTPLTPTLLLAESMAADESLSPAARADANFIAQNTRVEVQLINDLLDLTKVREHKLVLDKQSVHIHQLLEHSKRLVQTTVDAKQIRLDYQFHAERDVVIGDGARLQQVFWNLLGNAAKFTPFGGRVEVQTCIGKGADVIEVLVCDNGRGIAPEVLSRLFHAFEQGSTDVTRSFGGLGLGLSIAKALVEMHNGTIIATSEGEGKGAQFVVRLPLSACTSNYETATTAAIANTAAAPAASSLTEARILLVEDNAATAAILQRLLTKLRCRWSTAGSVTDALLLARSSEFDVLICDVGLPDGSGLEIIGKMRALQPACKAITLSGCGTAEDAQRSLYAGAAIHITKPVRCAELTSTIERLLLEPKASLPSLEEGLLLASVSSSVGKGPMLSTSSTSDIQPNWSSCAPEEIHRITHRALPIASNQENSLTC